MRKVVQTVTFLNCDDFLRHKTSSFVSLWKPFSFLRDPTLIKRGCVNSTLKCCAKSSFWQRGQKHRIFLSNHSFHLGFDKVVFHAECSILRTEWPNWKYKLKLLRKRVFEKRFLFFFFFTRNLISSRKKEEEEGSVLKYKNIYSRS